MRSTKLSGRTCVSLTEGSCILVLDTMAQMY